MKASALVFHILTIETTRMENALTRDVWNGVNVRSSIDSVVDAQQCDEC